MIWWSGLFWRPWWEKWGLLKHGSTSSWCELKVLLIQYYWMENQKSLSPFLFLICTKGLHGLIRNAAREGKIRGFSLCKRGPKLTHLFFADDSLLFCKANSDECNIILNLLAAYESVSDQKVDISETTLFFSKSTLDDIKEIIKGLLGVQEIQHYEKYFGLP